MVGDMLCWPRSEGRALFVQVRGWNSGARDESDEGQIVFGVEVFYQKSKDKTQSVSQRSTRGSTGKTMARIHVLLCAAASLLSYTCAFSLVGRREIAVISKTPSATRSPLFQQKCPPTRLFESTEDDVDDPSTAVVEEDDINARGGLIKILFISVPLFFKFCIVLMVKFLTDLVVYPLLILYRLARLTKRRFLKLAGMDTKKKKKT